jgi:phage terminase small subunit
VGRPRKPVEKHVRDGTYRADRHGPKPDADEQTAPPVKPEDLDEDTAECWDRLVKLLRGIVRDRDSTMLAELCWQWAELQRIKAVLGVMVPGEKGYNALLVAAGICTDKLDRLASRFGLTPADRAKIHAEGGTTKARVATRPKTALDKTGPPAASKLRTGKKG